MDYEEFVSEFSEALKAQLPEGTTTERYLANKINGDRDALVIAYAASPIKPTVYLQENYELYNNGLDMIEIVEQVVAQLKFAFEHIPKIPELSFESAQKKLYATVINAEANEKILHRAPHDSLEDLAVVARFRVDDTASFLVTNNICSELKMTEEEVMSIARANTEKEEFTCRSSLKQEERLSNNVYLYHINEKKLTMVGANSVSKAKEMPQQKQATKIAGRCH